jgi:hypothetical protein
MGENNRKHLAQTFAAAQAMRLWPERNARRSGVWTSRSILYRIQLSALAREQKS